MMSKRLFMETTQINPSQTVSQIQEILGKYGAVAILIEYESSEVVAISFRLKTKKMDIPFRLPCRWRAIYSILRDRRKHIHKGTELKIVEQSKRVAWRQILRWVEAQLALVATEMVSIQEVFLPYTVVNKEGQTLYEKLEKESFNMLEYNED